MNEHVSELAIAGANLAFSIVSDPEKQKILDERISEIKEIDNNIKFINFICSIIDEKQSDKIKCLSDEERDALLGGFMYCWLYLASFC